MHERQTKAETRAHPMVARALAITSAVLLAFCFPRWNIESLVWVWMLPLAWSLWFIEPKDPTRRARHGFRLGYLCGLVFFLINLHWIWEVSPPGLPILAAYLAVYFGAWGAFAATIARPREDVLAAKATRDDPRGRYLRASLHGLGRASLAASFWCGTEWLRGWVFTGFGWNGLGVAFHDNMVMMQSAEFLGVTGLAFLPMFVGLVLTITLRRFQLEIRHSIMRPHLDFGVAMLLVVAVFTFGVQRLAQPLGETTPLRTLLVQGGFAQDVKMDPDQAPRMLEDYERLTAAHVEAMPLDLVIWPESALPTSFFEDPYYPDYFNRLLSKGSFSILVGADDISPEGAFNAAMMLRGGFNDPKLQVYRKVHLVPFGEFVPFRKQVPWLGNLLSKWIPGDFQRGPATDPMKLEIPAIQIVPLICFEDTVGRIARRFVRPGPQLIVNLTNDGWFNRSANSEQHLANARFRAVELRRPMIRVCNTGVTCVVDSFGRVLSRFEAAEEGSFGQGAMTGTVDVPNAPSSSFYTLHGDLFTALLVVCCLPSAFLAIRRRPKKS